MVDKRKDENRARSKEEIFTSMHRQLRRWNNDIPESPDRLDPVLKILLQLYAHQLERIDSRLDKVWSVAVSSLMQAMCPDELRWPVPAFTVMRGIPTDPMVEIDKFTRFYYKESREGGKTFYFTPLKTERLVQAEIKKIILACGHQRLDFSPTADGNVSFANAAEFGPGEPAQVYIGVDHVGQGIDFSRSTMFVKSDPAVVSQLRWGKWYPGSNFGDFYEDLAFCPGMITTLRDIVSGPDRDVNWGGLRGSTDLFRPLEDNFIIIPKEFAQTWESGQVPSDISGQVDDEGGNLYWIKIELPPGGDRAKLINPIQAYFNCFIAVNKDERSLFKHTGGNQLVEVELPEDTRYILGVTSVADSTNQDYMPRHEVGLDSDQRFYTPEQRGQKLILWFDFPGSPDIPPDSLTIRYDVTAGPDANGIGVGKINSLYENHPGLEGVENVTPSGGAIPAKTEQQIMAEIAARLRNRDRAMSFSEIARWIRTYDPRITAAQCENGVELGEHGIRRCIVVRAAVIGDSFHSDDEINLLKIRLKTFLKDRAPVNTQFRVEVDRL